MADVPQVHKTEENLRLLLDMIEQARNVPMSSSAMINREEVLEIIQEALDQLPDEIRAARWLLKEREQVRAKAQREAEDIIADAKSHVARMVQRTEVVKAAKQRAQALLDDAEAEANRMQHEAEDYCDQKLASFEVVLDRLHKTVTAGRRKLATTIAESELTSPTNVYADADDSEAATFFDADSQD